MAIAVAALLSIGVGVVVSSSSSSAAVTAVIGNAFGVSAPNITLFGGTQPAYGPKPVVTLPSTGSGTPITASDPSESVAFGPATLFTSGPVSVSTQGTPTSQSVTSSAMVQAGASTGCPGTETSCVYGGPFTANAVSSTCTANGTNSGSTTITGGVLATATDTGGNPTTTVDIPANPTPNYTKSGFLYAGSTDKETFTYTFNEQKTNTDGSITVTAAHDHLNGPTAKGDIYIGQVTCGLTGTVTTTTASTVKPTTTTAATTTTSTTVKPTTTTAASTTTTVKPTTTTAASTTTTVKPTTTTAASTTTTVKPTTTTAASTTTTVKPTTTTAAPTTTTVAPTTTTVAPTTTTVAPTTTTVGATTTTVAQPFICTVLHLLIQIFPLLGRFLAPIFNLLGCTAG
ncbi:MAG TPA: hypothetical protein VHT75_01825 [Acidimicrobiales bacterium]|nr:hypothetical protein [Acidimicrobiales bacterium]